MKGGSFGLQGRRFPRPGQYLVYDNVLERSLMDFLYERRMQSERKAKCGKNIRSSGSISSLHVMNKHVRVTHTPRIGKAGKNRHWMEFVHHLLLYSWAVMSCLILNVFDAILRCSECKASLRFVSKREWKMVRVISVIVWSKSALYFRILIWDKGTFVSIPAVWPSVKRWSCSWSGASYVEHLSFQDPFRPEHLISKLR